MTKKKKTFGVDIKSIDDKEKTIDFLVTTDAVDRMGEIVTMEGWQIDNYKKNPVMLADHVMSVEKVIGKSIELSFTDKGMVSKTKFAVEESPLAKLIYGLYKSGFLSAVSVGFMEKKGEYRKIMDKEKERWIWHILEKEMLEFSAVAIPANPEALIQKGLIDDKDASEIFPTEKKKEKEDIDIVKEFHNVAKIYRKGFLQIRKALDVEALEDEEETIKKTIEAFELTLKNNQHKEPVKTLQAIDTRTVSGKELSELCLSAIN